MDVQVQGSRKYRMTSNFQISNHTIESELTPKSSRGTIPTGLKTGIIQNLKKALF